MKKKQGGQALPLGIALVLFGVLSALVLFNTGQTASNKTRLANAADAAAYSGLLWQARALNFQAYTNRAMVANQVSIAQAVSLQSWVSYGRITSENVSAVLSGVPMINVLTQGMSQAFGAADTVVGPVAEAAVPVVDWVNSVLAQSQRAMYLGSFAATPAIVEKIVEDNDERFEVDSAYNIGGMLSNLNDWKNFTQEYDTSDKEVAQGRADIINQSLDRFTRKRDWKFFSRYFPITPLTRVRVHRRGTTRLVQKEGQEETQWEWKAKDSVSLAIKIWRPLRSSKRVEIPIGWGQAYTNLDSAKSLEDCSGNPVDYLNDCDRWLRENKLAEYFSDNNVRSVSGTSSRTRIDASYGGIRDYRSIAVDVLEQENPVVELKVEVSMPVDTINSSETFVAGSRWKAPIEAPGHVLSSVSAAELFYERPDARDVEFEEHANGYNPYWDVRLKSVSNAERLVALSLRGSESSSSVPNSRQKSLDPFSESDSKVMRQRDEESALDQFQDQVIAQLSDALGVDADALMDPVAEFEQASEEALFDFIDSQLGDELAQLEELVANELRRILAEAIKRILEAALSKVIDVDALQQAGDDLGAEVDSILDDLDTNINEIVEDVEGIAEQAEMMIDEFEAEMSRIREQVAREFAIALEEITAAFDAEKQELIDRYNELAEQRDEYNGTFEEPPPELIAELKEIQEAIKELVIAELEHRLALALVEIVDRATDMFDLSYAAALEAVRAILLSDDEDINPLQITELDDGDDDDW